MHYSREQQEFGYPTSRPPKYICHSRQSGFGGSFYQLWPCLQGRTKFFGGTNKIKHMKKYFIDDEKLIVMEGVTIRCLSEVFLVLDTPTTTHPVEKQLEVVDVSQGRPTKRKYERKGNLPRSTPKDFGQKVRTMLARGMEVAEIAEELQTSRAAVYYHKKNPPKDSAKRGGQVSKPMSERVCSICGKKGHTRTTCGDEKSGSEISPAIMDGPDDLSDLMDVPVGGNTVGSPFVAIGDDREMDPLDEEVLAQEIRERWGENNESAVAVSVDLHISMGQFNRIIQKYKIVRS